MNHRLAYPVRKAFVVNRRPVMKLKATALALATLGAGLAAGAFGGQGGSGAEAFGNPRVIVNVAGPEAGTVEFENVESFLPELLFDIDTGELVMPTNYCGLRITHVGGIWWEDAGGDVVEAENHGEVAYESGEGYMFMGEDITDAYLGGVEFTGALDTCEENDTWYFPIPLSYGGNGPQFGVQRLVLDLDQPPGFQPTIEFLDAAQDPIELPDLYEDWEPETGSIEEYCEQVPEFCEPDPVPWDLIEDILWGCSVYDARDCPEEPKEYPSLTLGCMAYATGCDPDPEPQPIETFAAPSGGPSQQGGSLQVASPNATLRGTTP
jgi:hypothetical protein